MAHASGVYVSTKDPFIEPVMDIYKEDIVSKTMRIEIDPHGESESNISLAILLSHIEMDVVEYIKEDGVLKLKFSEPVSISILDDVFNHYIPIRSILN
jgi:hypothetical protein